MQQGKDGGMDGSRAALPTRMAEGCLNRLLQMAGPADGAELLKRLGEDLGKAEADLAVALARRDDASVQAITHVLIAVAGTVGARGLEDAARALNTATHRSDAPFPDDLAQLALADLAALRTLIARREAEGSPA